MYFPLSNIFPTEKGMRRYILQIYLQNDSTEYLRDTT